MARFALSACLSVLFVFPAAASLKRPSDLTILLNFRGAHSDRAAKEMQKEASLILKDAGVNLSWRPLAGAASENYADVVVMTFTGSCEFASDAQTYDEPGPYARTWMTNGQAMPFGEVDCSRVVSSVRDALWGENFVVADRLVGRALGRVVAHELVHILTGSTRHAEDGVQKAALSGHQLIGGSLMLDKEDIGRLRTRTRQ